MSEIERKSLKVWLPTKNWTAPDRQQAKGRNRMMKFYRPEDGWNDPRVSLPQIGQRIDCVFRGLRCCGDWRNGGDGVPAFHYASGSERAENIERWRLEDGGPLPPIYFPSDYGAVSPLQATSDHPPHLAAAKKRKRPDLSPEERERRRQWMLGLIEKRRAARADRP